MCNINKALIVTPFFKPNIGGAETFAEDLAKALAKKYNVHICTVKLDKPITFEGMDYRKAFYLIRRLSLPLLSMVRRYKYERVFALGLMSILLCSLFRIKFDAVIFNLFKKKSWRNYLLNRAGKIYVEGNTGKNNLLSIGIPESKIVVFHHWCDQSVFTWKERVNKNLRVLFIGRPIAIKGKHIFKNVSISLLELTMNMLKIVSSRTCQNIIKWLMWLLSLVFIMTAFREFVLRLRVVGVL